MKDYDFYKSNGICPRCRVKNAFYNHVYCEDCLEKIALANIKFRDPKAKEYSMRYRDRNKKRYEERKKNGLCVRCGKPATNGTLCAYHYYKRKEQRKKYSSGRERGEAFRKRIKNGLCMYCGKPQVYGYKFCEEHLKERQEICRNLGKNNTAWRKEITGEWENAKLKSSLIG